MALIITPLGGATPLGPDALADLRLAHLSTLAELNEAEAANLLDGERWAMRARRSRVPGMLADAYLQDLHRRMYGAVWRWAGSYRLHETNIGCTSAEIRVRLRLLYADAGVWIADGVYEPREIAVRLHHRLVGIHPFVNGNGRFARLYGDVVLARHYRLPRLSWGGGSLGNTDPHRSEYIAALQAADRHDFAPLLRLAGTA